MIIFDELDGPLVQNGTLSVVLPLPRVLLSEVQVPLLIEFPMPEVAFEGAHHTAGTLSIDMESPIVYFTDAIPGIVTTVAGNLVLYGPRPRSTFGQTVLEAPDLVLLDIESPLPVFVGTGFNSVWGTLSIDMARLSIRAYEVYTGPILEVESDPFVFSGAQVVAEPNAAIFGLLDVTGSLLGSTNWVFKSKLLVNDEFSAELLFAMQSNIAFADEASVLGTLRLAITSNVTLRDAFRFLIEVNLEDEVEFTDDIVLRAEVVMRLASQLVLEDETIGWMMAVTTIASAFVLRDRLNASIGQTFESVFEIVDELTAQLAAIITLLSAVEIADEMAGTLHAFVTMNSNIVIDDDFAALLSMLMELDDEVVVYTRFVTPDGETFIGYIVNVRTSAVTTMTNYPFNAFTTVKVGGRTIGLATGQYGVYRLGGDTDDGEPIRARARLGLNDFGTNQLKRVSNSFIGYTSDGKVVLKTVTTDGGRKKENWYTLKPRSAHSAVDGRFDIAKGLTARYWGWELENAQGSDFELADLKVWPMPLQRRKSGR